MPIQTTPNAIVYTEDMLTAESVKNLAQSGFTTVIVGLFHVHSDGSLWYNDSAVEASHATLISSLKSTTGSKIEKVLISIGGGNWKGHPASVSDSDYPAMKNTWITPAPRQSTTSQQNIVAFMQDARVDGLDLDYEPEETSFDVDFIIQIVQDISAQGFMLTAAPYKHSDYTHWQSVLEACATDAGNLFSWWNLQLYGGADYENWYSKLSVVWASTGIQNAELAQFLVPGYSLFCGDIPDNLIDLVKDHSALNAAFIWKYDTIADCANAQATYILQTVNS
jgi:hypothetical protein